MHVLNLFDKMIGLFLENIGASLATEKIRRPSMVKLYRLNFGNSKPHQRTSAARANFNVHYTCLSIVLLGIRLLARTARKFGYVLVECLGRKF